MKPYPIPEVSDAEVGFGAQSKHYLPREVLGAYYYNFGNSNATDGPEKFCYVASMLFMKGGKVEDYGLQLKPDVDQEKAYRAISALLRSWEPKHEVKIGTVGYALSQWCEIIPSSQ